jgi:hypothetical protein
MVVWMGLKPNFTLLKLPLKFMCVSKVVKSDSKIIICLCGSKSPTHYEENTNQKFLLAFASSRHVNENFSNPAVAKILRKKSNKP